MPIFKDHKDCALHVPHNEATIFVFDDEGKLWRLDVASNSLKPVEIHDGSAKNPGQ